MKAKRLFAWVVLLALVICQLPAPHAHAHEHEHEETVPVQQETAQTPEQTIPKVEEEVVVPPAAAGQTVASGTCGENLTWTLNADGLLTISGTGNMEFFWTTTVPWHSHRAAIRKVVIRDGVTNIGDYAFCDCPNLTEATIPASVTRMEFYAFSNCGMLSKVTYCGTEAQWSEINIDTFNSTIDTVERTYHNYCGGDCKTPEICAICGAEGNQVHTSESGVCERCGEVICKVIERGTCGENLTWTLTSDWLLTISGIGDMADYSSVRYVPWRYYRESVLKVVIESGVTTIGDRAFTSCSSLTEITIPDSVTAIGRHAFGLCSNLTSITIPKSITDIEESVFSYCSSLTEVSVPQGVTSIGSCTFEACLNLTSVTIPDSVTYIGEHAFANCNSLAKVDLPDCVTEISDYAFQNCYALAEITIPDSVTSIGNYGFYNCTNLKEVVLPAEMYAIGDSAFYYCNNLEKVYHKGTEADWDWILIDGGNEPLLNATIVHNYTGAEPGDMNDDGVVNDADAVHLLRHTLFPDRFAVNQEPDVNNDGAVNDTDAVYLLRFTLFPERFPLYPNK